MSLSADTPLIHSDCNCKNVTYGRYCEVGQGARLLNVDLGDYSYCDRYADIANAKVGKFANIASFSRVGPTDHPMEKASLHHFLYRSASYWDDAEDDPAFFAHRTSRIANIGHDTWIGHGAIVRPEITVGTGAVVAAGAVVTHDVAPYMVVAGIPARPLKQRYTRDVAERMQSLAWWDWDHQALRKSLDDFRTLPAEAFLEKYDG